MLLGLTDDLAEHGCARGLASKRTEILSRKARDLALTTPVECSFSHCSAFSSNAASSHTLFLDQLRFPSPSSGSLFHYNDVTSSPDLSLSETVACICLSVPVLSVSFTRF